MTFGALVFGIGTFLVAQPTLDAKVWLFGILSGLFWSLGQSQQFQAMKYIGVSLTVPMSTGMQLVANTLAGACCLPSGRRRRWSCSGFWHCSR